MKKTFAIILFSDSSLSLQQLDGYLHHPIGRDYDADGPKQGKPGSAIELDWSTDADVLDVTAVTDPAAETSYASTATDELIMKKVRSGEPIVYYVGCAWNGQAYYHGWSHNLRHWPTYMRENSWEALNEMYK